MTTTEPKPRVEWKCQCGKAGSEAQYKTAVRVAFKHRPKRGAPPCRLSITTYKVSR